MRVTVRSTILLVALVACSPWSVGRVFTARLAPAPSGVEGFAPIRVEGQQPEVRASNGWVAEPPAGSTTASAYVDISNPGMYDIYVVAATSEVAGKVEFREMAGKRWELIFRRRRGYLFPQSSARRCARPQLYL